MTARELASAATDDQVEALRAFDAFLHDREQRVFVLTGAAGTGKTTLLARMVDSVDAAGKRQHVAALTGRAASVVTQRTGIEASTLHSFLYRFDTRKSKVLDSVPKLVFSLRNQADNPVSVVFVDEVSMLGASSDEGVATMQFGSGNLAADLLSYLFGSSVSSEAPKLVLIGDPYQLSPVREDRSVAFEEEAWDTVSREALGRTVPTSRTSLTTVHRQGDGGILGLATRFRDALIQADYRTTPHPESDDPDVTQHLTAGAGISGWAAEVARDPRSTAVIGYTNQLVSAWNRLVRRERWGDADLDVCVGDLLVNTRRDPRTDLDNGEILVVRSAASSVKTIAHLGRAVHLREVTLQSTLSESVHQSLLAENALASDERTMSREDFQVLWVDFSQRHRGLKSGTPEFWDAAFRDPILNPIVAKYGYALTAHKAQGGEWPRVIVDFNQFPVKPDSEDGFRWTYTAISRARDALVLIDQPHRSTFSRLAAADPLVDELHVGEEDERGKRRVKVEAAVEDWADDHGFQCAIVERKDWNTRFETADRTGKALFDVYFDGDGIATKRLPVRASDGTNDGLLPPLRVIERASFEGMPRPTDERVDEALESIERALAEDGLIVWYRRAGEWQVELEVGDETEAGVLRLDFRKTGVFSNRQWKRRPDDDVMRRTDAALERLARG